MQSVIPAESAIGPKPWGIPAVLAVVTPPLLLLGISVALAAAADTSDDLTSGEVITGLVLTIFLIDGLIVAGPAIFAFWRYGLGWTALGLRRFDSRIWWWPIVAAAAAQVGVVLYGIVATVVAGGAPDQDLDALFNNPAVLPLTGFATVIVAPFAEEIFFRGFIFPGLLRPFGVVGAMLASGLLFGIFHITDVGTIGLVLPFGAIGVLFAWLYYRSGSLWTAIFAHATFNAVSFVFLSIYAGTNS